jgi:hypothetical protein
VGLGVAETSTNWRDVDFGLRSSAGKLTVYEKGVWRTAAGSLVKGDVLEIYVGNQQLEYRLNGSTIYSRPLQGTENLYVDSSFKSGFIKLDNFMLVTD